MKITISKSYYDGNRSKNFHFVKKINQSKSDIIFNKHKLNFLITDKSYHYSNKDKKIHYSTMQKNSDFASFYNLDLYVELNNIFIFVKLLSFDNNDILDIDKLELDEISRHIKSIINDKNRMNDFNNSLVYFE